MCKLRKLHIFFALHFAIAEIGGAACSKNQLPDCPVKIGTVLD
jgi:hypothetical protein